MIDTIRIAIHDLYEHRDIVKYIRNIESGKSNKVAYTKEYTEEQNDSINKKPVILKQYYYLHTGKVITRNVNSEVKSKSSEYGVICQIEEHKDQILLEFSVPKWIFGTNVLQFLEHFPNRDFNHVKNKHLRNNYKNLYSYLWDFLDSFFQEAFNVKIQFKYVELRRIDFCYNQVFTTREECLKYLDYCRKVKKKWSRFDNGGTNYKSGISYKSERYYFKIYHKGSEFKVNDKKKLRKINEIKAAKGQKLYNIKRLQDLADRTLRYEMEFKPKMLNYIYKQRLFRENCPEWKRRKKSYVKIQHLKTRYPKEIINPKSKNFVSKVSRLKFDYIDSFMNKVSRVMFYYKPANIKSHFHTPYEAMISENTNADNWDCLNEINAFGCGDRLFMECYEYFQNILNEFKISKKPTLEEFKDRANKYTEKVLDNKNKAMLRGDKKKEYYVMQKSKMYMLFNMLQRSCWKDVEYDLISDNVVSKRTFQRWKKVFKEMGYDNTTVVLSGKLNSDMTYTPYHEYIQRYSDELFLNRLQLEYFEKVKILGK